MLTKRLLNIFFAIMLGAFSTLSYCPPKAQNAPAMPDLNISPDQMQNMEKLMGGMEKFYENLSPEEKAQFEKELTAEVEKEQKKLEAMTPDQQQKYVAQAFDALNDFDIDEILNQVEQEEGQQIPTEINNTEDKPSQTQKANLDAENAQNKKKIIETLKLIEDIIKVLNSLNSKLNSIMPSAQDVIDKWIQKGNIQGVSSWKIFNQDLQTMKQRLEKLKQVDPTTGKYYYLDNIKNVEKLYGQLEMLFSTIQKYEPIVKITPKTGEVEAAAKSALTKLVNSLADTTKTITKNIDEIISKFEKTDAPKFKKQEEAKVREAKQKSRPRAGQTARAGKPEPIEREEAYSPYGLDSSPSYYSPYSGSYGSSGGDRPDTTPYYSSPSSFDSPSSKPSSPSAGTPASTDAEAKGGEAVEKAGEPKKDAFGKPVATTDDKTKLAETKAKPVTGVAADKKKAIDPKLKPIKNKINIVASQLDEIENSFKDKEKELSDAELVSKLEEAAEKTEEFVESINKEAKNAADKNSLKDTAVKNVLNAHKKLKEEIAKKQEVPAPMVGAPQLSDDVKTKNAQISKLKELFRDIESSIRGI